MAPVGPVLLPPGPVAGGQMDAQVVVLVGPGANTPERAVTRPRKHPTEAAAPGQPPLEVARPPDTEVEKVPSARSGLTVAIAPAMADRFAEDEAVAAPVARLPPKVTGRAAELQRIAAVGSSVATGVPVEGRRNMAMAPGAAEAGAPSDTGHIARAATVIAAAVVAHSRAIGQALAVGPTGLAPRPPFRKAVGRPAGARPTLGSFAGVLAPVPSGEAGDTVAPAGAPTRPLPAPTPAPPAAIPRAAPSVRCAAPSVRAVLNPLVLPALRLPFRAVPHVALVRVRPMPKRQIEVPWEVALKPPPGVRRKGRRAPPAPAAALLVARLAGDTGHRLLPVAKCERPIPSRLEVAVEPTPGGVDAARLRSAGASPSRRLIRRPAIAAEAVRVLAVPAGEAGHTVATVVVTEGRGAATGPRRMAAGALA